MLAPETRPPVDPRIVSAIGVAVGVFCALLMGLEIGGDGVILNSYRIHPKSLSRLPLDAETPCRKRALQ